MAVARYAPAALPLREFAPGARGRIRGTLGEIRFRDTRTGSLVAAFERAEGGACTIVGTLPDADEGATLELEGEVVDHERFGPQFVIERVAEIEADAEATRAFLASGLIPHVGPATAAAVVEALGADALPTLLADPSLWLRFRGVTPARLPAVRRALRHYAAFAATVGVLDPYGVSFTVARRAWRRYGATTADVVRANPWRLAAQVAGVGFRTADRIAVGLGIALDSEARHEAALLQALRDAAAEQGHTVLDRTTALERAAALAGLTGEEAASAADRLVATRELESVVYHDRDGVIHPAFALPHLAAAERLVASKVRTLAGFLDAEPITVGDTEIDAIETERGIAFDESQRRAIRGALEEHVTVVTGGPGTGKTTIMRAVLTLALARGQQSVLLSPTGRAAKRLAEATGHPASTVHRYLGYSPHKGFAGPPELPDLVIVDEASMLDVGLAARLMSTLPPYARLLLVGDADQLPAVGPGNVLADLIASPQVNVFRLRTIHRQAAGSGVPELAASIREGIRKPAFDGRTTRMVEAEEPQAIAEWIRDAMSKRKLPAERIQVLTPTHRGPAGTVNLNRELQELLNPPVEGMRSITRGGVALRPGDRLIVTGNDYDNGLFNGEMFVLRAIADDGSVTLAPSDGGPDVVLPAGASTPLALAYAMSIHKAQGSEYDVVILCMHSSVLGSPESGVGRQLLYTAVSRSRDVCVIVGQAWALASAISRRDPNRRRTQLRDLLGSPEDEIVPVAMLDDEDYF